VIDERPTSERLTHLRETRRLVFFVSNEEPD